MGTVTVSALVVPPETVDMKVVLAEPALALALSIGLDGLKIVSKAYDIFPMRAESENNVSRYCSPAVAEDVYGIVTLVVSKGLIWNS